MTVFNCSLFFFLPLVVMMRPQLRWSNFIPVSKGEADQLATLYLQLLRYARCGLVCALM